MIGLPLAALVATALQGALDSNVPLASDEVRVIAFRPSDPVLEAHGPSRTFEYTADFEGTLHLWSASEEVDPLLRVHDERGRLLTEDRDGGGGTTAWVHVPVEIGSQLSVLVAVDSRTGALELHVASAPETDSTLMAADGMARALTDLRRRRASGTPEEARSAMDALISELLATHGRESSERLATSLYELGMEAGRLGYLDVCSRALESAVSHWTRTRPATEEGLRKALDALAESLRRRGDPAAASARSGPPCACCRRITPRCSRSVRDWPSPATSTGTWPAPGTSSSACSPIASGRFQQTTPTSRSHSRTWPPCTATRGRTSARSRCSSR